MAKKSTAPNIAATHAVTASDSAGGESDGAAATEIAAENQFTPVGEAPQNNQIPKADAAPGVGVDSQGDQPMRSGHQESDSAADQANTTVQGAANNDEPKPAVEAGPGPAAAPPAPTAPAVQAADPPPDAAGAEADGCWYDVLSPLNMGGEAVHQIGARVRLSAATAKPLLGHTVALVSEATADPATE